MTEVEQKPRAFKATFVVEGGNLTELEVAQQFALASLIGDIDHSRVAADSEMTITVDHELRNDANVVTRRYWQAECSVVVRIDYPKMGVSGG